MICSNCAHANDCVMFQFAGTEPPITACYKFKQKQVKTINFVLDGCDISFYAQAPADITLEQLLKQADRIDPDWCACGIRSDVSEWRADGEFRPEIVFKYDDVIKTSDDVSCKIHEDGGWRTK